MTQNNLFAEKIATIRLAKTNRVGGVTFYKMLEAFGNAQNALLNINNYLSPKYKITIFPEFKVLDELEKLKNIGGDITTFGEPSFPNYLKNLGSPIVFLEYKGNIQILQDLMHNIAIVGARKCSMNGGILAQEISKELAKAEYNIVSGLAIGIDSYAYRGALPHKTVGVMASGINNIYPASNDKLYQEILSNNGLILSEQFLDTAPQADLFPKRNRIIAGISVAVVIIEAQLNSGTMTTAVAAQKQRKLIFAVPGHPFDVRSEGSNLLIKQGAKLVTNAQDIMALLQEPSADLLASVQKEDSMLHENNDNLFQSQITPTLPNADSVHQVEAEILQYISVEPTSISLLETELKIDNRLFNIALTKLLLSNEIELEDNTIRKIYKKPSSR